MRAAVPILHNLQKEFAAQVEFLCVYILEAHAMDEWPINSARASITGAPINFKQPVIEEERLKLAKQFVDDYSFEITTVVDLMDNSFEDVFASWPLRFYVIHEGRLTFKAQPRDSTYYFDDLRNFLLEQTK